MVRFRAEFTNTGSITKYTELWIEIKLNGVAKGAREKIKQAAWALFSEESFIADDVYDKDINPRSVTVIGYGPVIDNAGHWIGDPTGLQGPQGLMGAQGPQGPPGPQITSVDGLGGGTINGDLNVTGNVTGNGQAVATINHTNDERYYN